MRIRRWTPGRTRSCVSPLRTSRGRGFGSPRRDANPGGGSPPARRRCRCQSRDRQKQCRHGMFERSHPSTSRPSEVTPCCSSPSLSRDCDRRARRSPPRVLARPCPTGSQRPWRSPASPPRTARSVHPASSRLGPGGGRPHRRHRVDRDRHRPALVSRRLPRETVGRLTAAYLVAVFPANVYVAVADVDVEGQPGGVFQWIRLPLQAVFIAWALWSTRSEAAWNAPPNDLGHPCSASESHARNDPWNPRPCFRPSPSCHSSPSSPAVGRCSGSSPSATARWESSANDSSGPARPRGCPARAGPRLFLTSRPHRARRGSAMDIRIHPSRRCTRPVGRILLHLGVGREGQRSVGTAMTRVGGLLIAVPLVALAVELIRV